MQKKRIKKKIQLIRPSDLIIEEIRKEVEIAETPGSDDEKPRDPPKSALLEKLLPVICILINRMKKGKIWPHLRAVYLIKLSLLDTKMVSYANLACM